MSGESLYPLLLDKLMFAQALRALSYSGGLFGGGFIGLLNVIILVLFLYSFVEYIRPF
jgi:hypothetical protein